MKSFVAVAVLSCISLFTCDLSLYAMAPRLESIQVEGNKKTKSFVIERMSHLFVGDEMTERILGEAKDRLVSSGLFESVELTKKMSKDSSSMSIVIRVKEKMSWFVAPSFQASKDSLSGGIIAGESNLFGLDKKGLIFADYGPSNKRLILAYRDPNLLGTNFTVSVDGVLQKKRVIEYDNRIEIRRVDETQYGVTVIPGYRWSPKFTSSLGFYHRRVDETLKSQSLPLTRVALRDNDRDIAMVVRFEYDNSTNYHGYLSGAKISVENAFSDNRFYSDFDYTRQELQFASGLMFFDRQYNWVNHLNVKIGQDLPYYRQFTSGGTNLRGYIANQFRGDTRYSTSQEFLFPIHNFNRFLLRGIFGWDSHVIYFKDDKFSIDAWKNGLSAGFRLYTKRIVIPLLGFDVGWAVEDKTYATYLNIGATW